MTLSDRGWPLPQVLEWRFRCGIGFVRQRGIEAIGRYPLQENKLQPNLV